MSTFEKENYEHAIKERLILVLEKNSVDMGLWKRCGENAFMAGFAGTCGGTLPEGIYKIKIFKTGGITVERLIEEGASATFYVFDHRVARMYSALENLEKRSKTLLKFRREQ